MKIDSLKYVMLASSNVERSIEFYRDSLGLALVAHFGNFAFLDCDNVQLVLHEERESIGGDGSEIVFGVSSVGEAFRDLGNAGVAFLNEPRQVNAEAWAVNFRDPDGHLLSFYGAP